MRPIGRFAHLMSSQVQVEYPTGRDDYGKLTFNPTPVMLQCHISRGVRLVPTTPGNEIVDAVEIHLNSVVAVPPLSRITLSTGDVGSTESFDRQPRLLAVERRFDEKGPHHTVLYAGWAPRSV